MKKNLSLTFVLVALIAFVYWKEELGGQKRKSIEEKNKQAVSVQMEDLLSLQLPNASLIKEGNRLLTSKTKLPSSTKLLQEMITILHGLNIVRTFNTEEIKTLKESDLFGPQTLAFSFDFPGHHYAYRLGNALKLGQSFYVEMIHNQEKKLVLANDTSPMEGIYKDNEQLFYQKYHRLRILLSLNEEAFIDRRIFLTLIQKQFKESDIQSIAIKNFRNRPFSVNFKQSKTQPELLAGIKFNTDESKKFLQELFNLEADKLYQRPVTERKYLKNELSVMNIKFENQNVEIHLFKKFQNRPGIFLYTNLDSHIYELNSQKGRPFFSNVQDFWEKKIHWDEDIGLKDEFFTLQFSPDKKIPLVIPKQQNFEVKLDPNHGPQYKNMAVKQDAFKGLFTMLLGMGKFVQADRVSPLTNSEEEILNDSKNRLNILILTAPQNKIRLIRKADEIILSDLIHKVNFHYLVGADNTVSVKQNDYFESL